MPTNPNDIFGKIPKLVQPLDTVLAISLLAAKYTVYRRLPDTLPP